MFQTFTPAVYSSRDHHWFWASVGVCVGVYLFLHGFRLLQRKRLILNTPSSRIRSASMGPVEINGLAAGPYTLTAPITGVPCYYYRTKVWQLKQSGKKNEWDLAADECLHVPFFLDDNTGRLLVDPQGAEMDIHRDFHQEFDLAIPANVGAFLQRHQLDAGRRTKVEEYCIKPKNSLFVFGTLAENPGIEVSAVPIPSFPASAHTLSINLSGSMSEGIVNALAHVPGARTTTVTTVTVTRQENGQPQHTSTWINGKPAANAPAVSRERIADAMQKAGITSPAAWGAMGLPMPAIETQAATAVANPAEFDLHPRTVLMKGEHSPFMISWRSQRQIVGSLGWKSALMIWGGPALALLCLYFVFQHFGWL